MRRGFLLLVWLAASVPSLAGDTVAKAPLAPPPDKPPDKVEPPSLEPLPEARPAPDAAKPAVTAPASSASASTATPAPAPETVPDDGGFPDSVKAPDARKNGPDVAEEAPAFFQHVDELRKHNDPVLAADYLKEIITNSNNLPQDRARAIIALADVLDGQGQKAEELCWLKIWTELFPRRNEFAGVAYRMATLYTKMGMADLARDAYYLVLAHAVNQGEVKNPGDLTSYDKLTTATLWGLAANEYQDGDWARAAELFDRYRQEATAATPALAGEGRVPAGRLLLSDAPARRRDQALRRHPGRALPVQPAGAAGAPAPLPSLRDHACAGEGAERARGVGVDGAHRLAEGRGLLAAPDRAAPAGHQPERRRGPAAAGENQRDAAAAR
ncbi:MAG: hypothetical protein WDO13_06030 [Verrucomicrobiota bacterium]